MEILYCILPIKHLSSIEKSDIFKINIVINVYNNPKISYMQKFICTVENALQT